MASHPTEFEMYVPDKAEPFLVSVTSTENKDQSDSLFNHHLYGVSAIRPKQPFKNLDINKIHASPYYETIFERLANFQGIFNGPVIFMDINVVGDLDHSVVIDVAAGVDRVLLEILVKNLELSKHDVKTGFARHGNNLIQSVEKIGDRVQAVQMNLHDRLFDESTLNLNGNTAGIRIYEESVSLAFAYGQGLLTKS